MTGPRILFGRTKLPKFIQMLQKLLLLETFDFYSYRKSEYIQNQSPI